MPTSGWTPTLWNGLIGYDPSWPTKSKYAPEAGFMLIRKTNVPTAFRLVNKTVEKRKKKGSAPVSLSLVLDAYRKQSGKRFLVGQAGPQTSSASPTRPGIARGTMGVLGARTLQTRNPDAQMDKDRKVLLKSPVMQAFLRRSKGRML
jgi:hypothetical protein